MAEAHVHGGPIGRLPVVALVGRPNTGKSTLFNRLTRSRRAVVAPMPGVTRDRNVAAAEWDGVRFLAVDTGGFEADESEELSQAVRSQSLLAAEEADAIVMVLDARAGVNPLDIALIEQLRRVRRPLFLAVNKIDSVKQDNVESEFFALGVDTLYPISAEHGRNIDDLMTAVLRSLPASPSPAPTGETVTSVAIIGRPNVGKSSLLNRLVGYERSIVSAVPGTTRDAIDTQVTHGGHHYLLVDTAGMRRRARIESIVERASVVRAVGALERAEVALVVIDAAEGITEQDARLATLAWERGRAVALVCNKWDAVPASARGASAFARRLDEEYPSFAVVPKVFVSALTGHRVGRIWEVINRVAANHRLRVPTRRLNQVLERAVARQEPPLVKGKRPRLLYATQVATAPPTIAIFGSPPQAIHSAYQRYLINQLRSELGAEGTPIRISFRAKEAHRRQASRPPTRRRVRQ
jgi:GTP-binding protein